MKDKITNNEKGEILDENNSVEGSNNSDLVQHAVRDRRRQITGWQTFLTRIKDSNVSKMVMNCDTLEEMRKTIIKMSDIKSSSPKTFIKTSSKSISLQIKREPRNLAVICMKKRH